MNIQELDRLVVKLETGEPSDIRHQECSFTIALLADVSEPVPFYSVGTYLCELSSKNRQLSRFIACNKEWYEDKLI